jgi:subtilisin family serine protease
MKEEKNFYIVDGKKLSLNRVNSARLVTPAKDNHLGHVAARLARSTRIGIDTRVPAHFLVVRGDAEKLEIIKNYSDVNNTRSVFTDKNGLELVLTDDVLVKFTDRIDADARRELCEKLNCRIIDDTGNIWRIRVLDLDDDAPLDISIALTGEEEVVFAEPDALQRARYAAVAPPVDILFPNQWHLHNTGQGGGVVGADVRALDAWEVTSGSSETRVVIHDTGVDIDHPDLEVNITSGWDFDNDDSDASNDFQPHGTACAGVIAAAINGEGVVGIAPTCKIAPLRAAGAHPWSTWAKTFEWAAEHGDIISCSWTISENNILSEAIRKAALQGRNGKGIPIFCATGNEGESQIRYPSHLAETIAVGASTNEDILAWYSNYGPGIDFVAPSSGGTMRIETTDVQGMFGYNNKIGEEGNYCKAADTTGFGGTSSATPLVAGVAALMLSINPLLSAEQVRKILQETAVKIDPDNAGYDAHGWSERYGYGRIDAAEAVKAAQALISEG